MGFTVDERGAAGMYLMSIGGTASPDDVTRLGLLIKLFAEKGWNMAIESAKAEYRELHPGGCRMLSQGYKCQCFLCKMDNLKLPE